MERFEIVGVTSGSIKCGGGFPDFYTYVASNEVRSFEKFGVWAHFMVGWQVLPWIHKTVKEDEARLSTFNFLEDNRWMICKTSDDCASDHCEEDVCILSLSNTQTTALGPSSLCRDDPELPCHDGEMCVVPTCNRFGNACWCPRAARGKREVGAGAD
jgi:hypothetical protein